MEDLRFVADVYHFQRFSSCQDLPATRPLKKAPREPLRRPSAKRPEPSDLRQENSDKVSQPRYLSQGILSQGISAKRPQPRDLSQAHVFGLSALSQANDCFFARKRGSFFSAFFFPRVSAKKNWCFFSYISCFFCFWGCAFVLFGGVFFVFRA